MAISFTDDTRPIAAVLYDDGTQQRVGADHVTSIEAYWDNGRQWLAICQDGVLKKRVNAINVKMIDY